MIDQELINRINFLANKKKTSSLTSEEELEQKDLREKYIKEFRKGFKDRLMSIKVLDPEGKDVTPKKLKKAKMERKKN